MFHILYMLAKLLYHVEEKKSTTVQKSNDTQGKFRIMLSPTRRLEILIIILH